MRSTSRPPLSVSTPALLAAFLLLAFAACAPPSEGHEPRQVILMIGDGLGVSQLTFARQLLLEPGERLALESLPEVGLVTTWAADNLTTDSAAAATALATGVKTDNKALGVDPAGKRLKSLAEEAKEGGWEVGLVTNTSVIHATPASFYAHVENRYRFADTIGIQLLDLAPRVVLGGGYASFVPRAMGGKRTDGRNLAEEARAAGYRVWRHGEELEEPPPARLLGLLGQRHLGLALDQRRLAARHRDPTLAELTRTALEILEGAGAPFFLMVEGGRIDHAGHDFDAAGVAAQVAVFDAAVSEVLEFQEAHPDTLVILTADHATGGLAIADDVDWQGLVRQSASVESMTGAIREDRAGVEVLVEHTGYEDFEDSELDPVRAAEGFDGAKRALGRVLAKRNRVTWVPWVTEETDGHTGEDVPLFAGGPGAERFRGLLDNTEVHARLVELLGWSGAQGPRTESTEISTPGSAANVRVWPRRSSRLSP